MDKIKFSEIINVSLLKKMLENLYEATGIPIGILGLDDTIEISVGWQDICTKYHRVNQESCKHCVISDELSDEYIYEHIMDKKYIEYKCLNNMWDIAMPIIISEEHIATVFLGQFFYEDEIIDIEYFRGQAIEFGFDEKEYLTALKKVPVFSKKKIDNIIEYYSSLITMLAESGFRKLEYEKKQKELQKNQDYINNIFNLGNDAIFIHDIYGNIIDVNKTVVDMYGYSFKELMDMNIKKIISQNSPSTYDYVLDYINKGKNGDSMILELISKNKSNEEFWIEINIHITKIGEDDRVIATVRNITDRKQAELALQKEALEMENIRTEFFSNISHELRTPLNIILGTIQVIGMNIQDEEKPIDRVKLINSINVERQNCFRLLRLINNLIDSTKLREYDFKLNMVNCNIVNIIEEITLSVAQYMSSNKINIVFDTDVEEKITACDIDKIKRIMFNILSNCIKFTDSNGSVFVNIFDGKEYITISIEDTGIGIPKDKLSMIFDRFRQVDKSFTRNREGSGIGLYIVKSLVEMQGGNISVESEYGVGTKFLIKYPVILLDSDSNEEKAKLVNNMINDYEERVQVEFSDIYI